MRLRARIAMLTLIGLVLVTTGCTPALMAIQTEFGARGATEAEQQDAVRIAACESGGGDPLSIHPDVVSRGNYGMFQINWTAQRNRVTKLGFSKEQLLDPTVNARVAADLWMDLGRRFGTTAGWSCARLTGVH
jgi:hypothetical protein